VFVHAANGGGVLFNRFSCTLNGNPRNNESPLYPIHGGLRIEVPNRPNQLYTLSFLTPTSRCTGDGTMQLVYQTRNGPSYFQCVDFRLFNEGPGDAITIAANTMLAFLIGVLSLVIVF